MESNKNQGISKRGADIDSASLNLILVILVTIILMLAILASYFVIMFTARTDTPETKPNNDKEQTSGESYPLRVDGIVIELPEAADSKETIPNDLINSDKAVLVDVTSNEIIASRRAGQVIYPASMTKVMTLIIVAENLKSEAALDDVITISKEYNGNSGYGFKVGEKLTVKDLIYAAILQSDGVACLELADYIAGSEANFVKLMNEKAREMGLKEESTLFQNCTGLHHQYHFSTCRDIAVITAYAMKNPFCANVLTSIKYKPSENFRPDDGCTFWSTLLHNRLADGAVQPKRAEIIGGKTGLTEKDTSGYCIVSYAKGKDGHFYISVTAKAEGWDANVQDIISVFNEYVK